MHDVIRKVFLYLSLFILASCSRGYTALTWREQVRLEDGQVIIITQRRNCDPGYSGGKYDDCLSRENWLTFSLPQYSSSEIIWHERLYPMILNTHAGKLYVVGYFPSAREERLYGSPIPPYVGFVWDKAEWRRIPINDIPSEIYDANVYPGSLPSYYKLLTLETKNSKATGMFGDPMVAPDVKRIDPSAK